MADAFPYFFWSSLKVSDERTTNPCGWAKLEESIDFLRVCGSDDENIFDETLS